MRATIVSLIGSTFATNGSTRETQCASEAANDFQCEAAKTAGYRNDDEKEKETEWLNYVSSENDHDKKLLIAYH